MILGTSTAIDTASACAILCAEGVLCMGQQWNNECYCGDSNNGVPHSITTAAIRRRISYGVIVRVAAFESCICVPPASSAE